MKVHLSCLAITTHMKLLQNSSCMPALDISKCLGTMPFTTCPSVAIAGHYPEACNYSNFSLSERRLLLHAASFNFAPF